MAATMTAKALGVSDGELRFAKAEELLGQVATWTPMARQNGEVFGYEMPGSNGRVYRVTPAYCGCPDSTYRPGLVCKHRIAVQMRMELAAEKPAPAVIRHGIPAEVQRDVDELFGVA